MNEVIAASAGSFGIAVTAMFAENAVLSRALGVTRLVQMTGAGRRDRLAFGILLCVTQLLAAPAGWYASLFIADLPYRSAIRPAVYVFCVICVCLLERLIFLLPFLPARKRLIRLQPMAAVNGCVLGAMMTAQTQSFSLSESVLFGLGSGLGYMLSVFLVVEAQRRLRSRAVPDAFRGLPITLIYIGILAMAIYGFTGHTVLL